MAWRASVTAACVVLLAGCVSARLSRRYAEIATEPSNEAAPTATLHVFTLPPQESSTAPSVFNLAERAQAALVQALATQVKDPHALVAALGAPIAAPEATPDVQDRTVFRRVLVLSIENKSPGPADRISSAVLTIEVPDPQPQSVGNARFLSWNKIATEYETQDLGKVTFAQKSTLGVGLEGALPGINELGKTTATAGVEKGLQEEVQLRQRYVVTSGELSAKKARIIRQSVTGIDLTGNLVLEMTVAADPRKGGFYVSSIGGFMDDQGRPNPDGAKISTSYVRCACDGSAPLVARAQLDYVIRQVVFGGETITESDDVVRFPPGRLPSEVEFELLPASTLSCSAWTIEDSSRRILQMEVIPGGGRDVLYFDSYDAALEVLGFLARTGATSLAGRLLFFENGGVTQAVFQSSSVSLTQMNPRTGDKSLCAPAVAR
jgi:hypothetical protein